MTTKINNEIYKITMTYGLYIGLALSTLTLLFHLGGQIEIPGSKSGIFGTVITIFAMMYFGRKYQKQYYPEGINYGKAFGFTVLLSIFSSVILTFFLYFYYSFIAPNAIALYIEQVETALKEMMSLPEEQLNTLVDFYKQAISPGIMAFSVGFKQCVSGIFFGLIVAFFLKSPFYFNKKNE